MTSEQIRIRTGLNEIWVDGEDILHVRSHTMGEIDITEVKACFEAYRKLGCLESRKLQLMDIRIGVTVEAEARQYAAKHGKDFFLASAVVSNLLSVRLIVNFFNRFYRHDVPFRIFKTEEEALKWLRKIKSTSKI